MILFDVALFVQKKHDPGGRAGGRAGYAERSNGVPF